MKYIIICIFLLLFAFCFGYLCIKYRNPYKLIMVFGKKGAGKSTFMVKKVLHYTKKGRPCFCDTPVSGAYLYDSSDLGFIDFPENSVIFIDEGSIAFCNRDYSKFPKQTRDYFALQRHYKHTVYIMSQSFDVDKTIRQRCDSLLLLVNYFGWLSVGKKIRRRIVVVKPSEDSESRIADELIIEPWILALFGAREYIFVPRYVKYFDTHIRPQLQHKGFRYIEYPDGTPKKFQKKHKVLINI